MANGLKKSKDDIIQEDVQVSEEVLAEVVKAKAPKDSYALPELKEELDKTYGLVRHLFTGFYGHLPAPPVV